MFPSALHLLLTLGNDCIEKNIRALCAYNLSILLNLRKAFLKGCALLISIFSGKVLTAQKKNYKTQMASLMMYNQYLLSILSVRGACGLYDCGPSDITILISRVHNNIFFFLIISHQFFTSATVKLDQYARGIWLIWLRSFIHHGGKPNHSQIWSAMQVNQQLPLHFLVFEHILL